MQTASRYFLLAPLALLGACTVGPDFKAPAAPAETGYLPSAEAAQTQGGAPTALPGEGPQTRWWEAFGSAELNALVDRALANNRSLAAANATLRRAMAELAAARGTQLPQVDANARVDRQQINLAAFGFDGLGDTGNPEFELYSVGTGVTFDLDLFGGRRRMVEATAARAEAELRQTEAAHRGRGGGVVTPARATAAIHEAIPTAEALVAEDQRNVELTDRRRRGGEGTMVEVLTAQSQLAADKADLAPLRQQLAEARHMLAVLLGEAPQAAALPDFTLATITLPAEVPVTLPSQLVRKRPDILQAEADLHAATAEIGVATAAMYPNITLGANISQAAPGTGGFLTDKFRGYDIFAGLAAPIFHGGTLKAKKRAAVAEAEAAQARYQQTVLDAFGQVADLLTALQHDGEAVRDQREAVEVARRSLQLSRRSFEVGNSNVLQVLDSERIYQRTLSASVEARARQYRDVARLFVATAGGWTGQPASGQP